MYVGRGYSLHVSIIYWQSAFSRRLISVLNYICNHQMYRSKEIMLQRYTIAFLLQLLLLLSVCTLAKICDPHHIPRHLSNRTMLHTRILLLTGPFIFKYLWGTSMWLKPNPYSTHVRTENLQIIWLFSQMLWNQGETISILAVAVGRTFGTADASFCAWF